MGISSIEASPGLTSRPGVESSIGSEGPVRGIQSSAKVNIDPSSTSRLDLSGSVTVRTGHGAGGDTYTKFGTPKPSTPLSRVDLNA